MAVTLEQIDSFHSERDHSEWAAIGDDAKRNALIVRALDYVETNYAPLIENAENSPRYLMAVAILSLRMSQTPNLDVAQPVVKSEKKEGAGFKKEVEYFEPVAADPFPGVTKLFEPLKQSVPSPTVFFGKMSR